MTKVHRDEVDAAAASWGWADGLAGKRTRTQHLARRRDGNGVAAGAEAAVERAASGGGEPLRADVRDRFEASLGTDLSAVRVHRGEASAEASAAVNPKKGALATVSEKLDAKGTIGFGDMVAGAVHDYDNEHGVDATSEGVQVELYGDGKAGQGDEQRLAETALELGVADVRMARDLGEHNADPADAAIAAGSLVGTDGLYDAERVVPVALPDEDQAGDRMQVVWWQDDVEALLADAQFQQAAVLFANEKIATLSEIASGMGAEEKAAIEDGVIAPLKSDPIGTLRTVINWTPKLAAEASGGDATIAQLKGVTKESRARDYWKQTKAEGATDGLTITQRERLLHHLLQGGDDAQKDMLSILKTASDADQRALIKTFTWTVLFDAIDQGWGDGDEFAKRFPKDTYG